MKRLSATTRFSFVTLLAIGAATASCSRDKPVVPPPATQAASQAPKYTLFAPHTSSRATRPVHQRINLKAAPHLFVTAGARADVYKGSHLWSLQISDHGVNQVRITAKQQATNVHVTFQTRGMGAQRFVLEYKRGTHQLTPEDLVTLPHVPPGWKLHAGVNPHTFGSAAYLRAVLGHVLQLHPHVTADRFGVVHYTEGMKGATDRNAAWSRVPPLRVQQISAGRHARIHGDGSGSGCGDGEDLCDDGSCQPTGQCPSSGGCSAMCADGSCADPGSCSCEANRTTTCADGSCGSPCSCQQQQMDTCADQSCQAPGTCPTGCAALGQPTCADGSCGPCTTCAQNGQPTCGDGSCGNPTCSCAASGQTTCADGSCGAPSCSCAQNMQGDTCADGTCGAPCTCEQNQQGVTCASGVCAATAGDCPVCLPGQETCLDGTCAGAGQCSCESQSLVTCADATCAPSVPGCTCKQDNKITCKDGVTCADSADKCPALTCEEQGEVTCADGVSCAADSASCSCEDNGAVTCADGTCASSADACPAPACEEQAPPKETCGDGTCADTGLCPGDCEKGGGATCGDGSCSASGKCSDDPCEEDPTGHLCGCKNGTEDSTTCPVNDPCANAAPGDVQCACSQGDPSVSAEACAAACDDISGIDCNATPDDPACNSADAPAAHGLVNGGSLTCPKNHPKAASPATKTVTCSSLTVDAFASSFNGGTMLDQAGSCPSGTVANGHYGGDVVGGQHVGGDPNAPIMNEVAGPCFDTHDVCMAQNACASGLGWDQALTIAAVIANPFDLNARASANTANQTCTTDNGCDKCNKAVVGCVGAVMSHIAGVLDQGNGLILPYQNSCRSAGAGGSPCSDSACVEAQNCGAVLCMDAATWGKVPADSNASSGSSTIAALAAKSSNAATPIDCTPPPPPPPF